jgi:hypothetical protein
MKATIHADSFSFTDNEILAFTKTVLDTPTLNDAPSISPNLNKSDTFSVSQALSLSLGNSYTDSATISEVINVVTVASHSVLNAAGLNIGTLN